MTVYKYIKNLDKYSDVVKHTVSEKETAFIFEEKKYTIGFLHKIASFMYCNVIVAILVGIIFGIERWYVSLAVGIVINVVLPLIIFKYLKNENRDK